MPAQIVLVHDVGMFTDEAAAVLRTAGYAVAIFTDPMQALDALEKAETVEVLITRVRFPDGKSNGISLALVARNSRPGIRVVFTGEPEMARYADGIGVFLPAPVQLTALVETVGRLLEQC